MLHCILCASEQKYFWIYCAFYKYKLLLLDVENNLNKSNSPKATDYVKNIPTDDPSVQSASSRPDWREVNQLISEVATELDMDAQRAVAGLQRDKQLTARLRTLQGQRGVGEDGGRLGEGGRWGEGGRLGGGRWGQGGRLGGGR